MPDTRHRNVTWSRGERVANVDNAQLAVLMDIRDELQNLNRLLHCPNFLSMPRLLRGIRDNTANPRRQRSAKRNTK